MAPDDAARLAELAGLPLSPDDAYLSPGAAAYARLASLAGLPLSPAVVRALLSLLELGAPPSSVGAVLGALTR